MKHVLIICDGMGDLPIPELANKTPLEAAMTPNLDRMAKNGKSGLISILGPGVRPNSDEAHLALFGYDLKTDYPGRGPIEAAGVGIALEEGDIAIRGNLATVDKDLHVLDRRAGRIEDTSAFIKELDGLKIDGVEFLVKPGTAHRLIIVMRGQGLSDKITNSDVHYVTESKVVEHWEGLPVNVIQPLDDSPEAKLTAEVLEKFLIKAHEILEANPLNNGREFKANYILTRGPGYYKKLLSFAQKWRLRNSCCIAGAGLYKGIGMLTGMDLIEVKGATGDVDTDLEAKIMATKEKINDYDFIFLHIKPTDLFGHDGDALGKKNYIEKIDQAIGGLDETKATVAITADHSTPCSQKDHSADPVPLLIYHQGIGGDGIEKFGESECRKGSLGTIEGSQFMKIFLAV
jgi:2,3-bisphosphoglycerate-independent phosphoglycerate mutase